ncbi:DinB/UmuC family translesion DNA polymerase [Hahella aquimaris]|uniref:DinB/UmuC family translesion DNA polymerase n=1 Tax=Hahella sp. HNIBRBA332 TaxID=3015983 RepID=UPI00352C4B5C
MCSHSFGIRITCFQNMQEAVCKYTARAAEKLREKQLASFIVMFIQTGILSRKTPM